MTDSPLRLKPLPKYSEGRPRRLPRPGERYSDVEVITLVRVYQTSDKVEILASDVRPAAPNLG